MELRLLYSQKTTGMIMVQVGDGWCNAPSCDRKVRRREQRRTINTITQQNNMTTEVNKDNLRPAGRDTCSQV